MTKTVMPADPMGDSRISQAVFAVIIADIAAGEFANKALKAAGVPKKAFYALLATHAEAANRYAQAKLSGLEVLADEILEIADDGTNDRVTRVNSSGVEYEATDQDVIARSRLRVDSRKWLLSRLAPKKYGDRTDLTVANAEGQDFRVLARIERVIVDPKD